MYSFHKQFLKDKNDSFYFATDGFTISYKRRLRVFKNNISWPNLQRGGGKISTSSCYGELASLTVRQ